MKIVDFDGMFDEKIAQFVKERKKKRSSKAWEDVIPKLYKQFGDTYVAKIKCTPKEYYAKMSTETLVETLVEHVSQKISVPEFLISELEKREVTQGVLSLLEGDCALYAVGLLGDNPLAFDGYFSALDKLEGEEELKGEIVSILSEHADEVKTRALARYQKGVEKEYMLHILSRVKTRDEEVYQTLANAFLEADEWKLVLRAGYLATYGDERALGLLLRKLEDHSIGFIEFQELKYAVDALGGEYDEERDFSMDKDWKYFRITVVDKAGKRAYTNAYFAEELFKNGKYKE